MNQYIKTVAITLLLSCQLMLVQAQDAEALFSEARRLYQEEFKPNKALIYLDSSLSIDSSLYQRFSFRAQMLMDIGRHDLAIADVTKCIDKCACQPHRDSHVSGYYLDRARLYRYLGNETEALYDVNESIKKNPNNWKAYIFRSETFQKEGKPKLAIADLTMAINIDDNQAGPYETRGRLLWEIGDIEGACKDFSKIISWGFEEYKDWVKQNCR